MNTETADDTTLLYRLVIAGLVAIIAGLGFLVWGASRPVSLLPRLARTNMPAVPAAGRDLTLAQLVEGLSRLDGRPELLLDQAQSQRLVAVLPLFREALGTAGSDKGEPTVQHFGAMAREYLLRTLTPQQVQHLAQLAARGELAQTSTVALDRLPAVDRMMRRRAGIAADLSPSIQSPVRRSLDRMRVRDLVLGMLLLEQYREYRLTAEQAALMLPMQALFQDIFDLKAGEIGEDLVPVVDAQVRSILSESQQRKLLEVAQASRLSKIEVDEDEVIRQFCSLLAARQEGDMFHFRLYSLTAPLEDAREGPAVVAAEAELELMVAIRGIVLHLEPRKDLRLDDNQVAQLALLAPGIQECLMNLFNGVKDDRQPEIQIRVARLLRSEQIRHILLHKSDPVRFLDFTPGVEPVAAEFGRFMKARASGQTFVSKFESGRAQALKPPGAFARPGSAYRPAIRPNFVDVSPPLHKYVPLEAVVRVILFKMDGDAEVRLKRAQVEKMQPLLREIQVALNSIEKGAPREKSVQVTSKLEVLLTDQQKAFLRQAEQESPPNLQPARGESPLSRELARYLEARLANRDYEPLLNEEPLR